jgi:hypothetical protein
VGGVLEGNAKESGARRRDLYQPSVRAWYPYQRAKSTISGAKRQPRQSSGANLIFPITQDILAEITPREVTRNVQLLVHVVREPNGHCSDEQVRGIGGLDLML